MHEKIAAMRGALEEAPQQPWEFDEPSSVIWYDGREFSGDPEDPDIQGGQEEIARASYPTVGRHIANACPANVDILISIIERQEEMLKRLDAALKDAHKDEFFSEIYDADAGHALEDATKLADGLNVAG